MRESIKTKLREAGFQDEEIPQIERFRRNIGDAGVGLSYIQAGKLNRHYRGDYVSAATDYESVHEELNDGARLNKDGLIEVLLRRDPDQDSDSS